MAGRYPAYAAALSDDSLDNVADAMEGQDHAMSLKAMVEEAALKKRQEPLRKAALTQTLKA